MAGRTEMDWDEKKRRLIDVLEPIVVAYLYVIAVVSPILGLIFGIVLMKKTALEKNQRLGRNLLTISIVFLAVWMLCCLAYVALIVIGALGETSPGYY